MRLLAPVPVIRGSMATGAQPDHAGPGIPGIGRVRHIRTGTGENAATTAIATRVTATTGTTETATTGTATGTATMATRTTGTDMTRTGITTATCAGNSKSRTTHAARAEPIAPPFACLAVLAVCLNG